MLLPNDFMASEDYRLNKLPAVVATAEQHRLLNEAGLIRPPWLSCQICRSLWQLGRLLITMGRQLERRYAPAALRFASG